MSTLTSEQIEKMLAAAKKRPQLEALDWGGEQDAFEPPAPEEPAHDVRSLAKLVESDPKTYDARRARIRDRYIGVRFEGVARSGADLQDPHRVIKASRLAFEEGSAETALELLELAIEQNPYDESLWLAELEVSFLLRDAERFVDSARGFRAAHPKSKAWTDIERLGRSLAPGDDLFGGRSAARAHEHYGPWPDTPNWIQASWDLTSEVMAIDFHRAMTRVEEDDTPEPEPRGA